MNSLFQKCLQELSQKEEGLYSFILEILTSKRLLVDHQEILEDVLQAPQCKASNSQCFTFKKSMGIFLGSIGVSEILLKGFQVQSRGILLAPVFASGYCLLSSMKEYRDLRNRGRVSRIRKLLEDLNGFDCFLRRQMMFLREMSLFRSKIKCSSDWEAHLTVRTIKSVKRVCLKLFQEIQDLEEKRPVPGKYQGIYQPLENLEDCEYFQKSEEQFDWKNIKEFFNIFLYLQSQFLVRISLTIVFDEEFSVCEKKIEGIRREIQGVLKENSQNLDYFLQPTSTEVTRFSVGDPQDPKGAVRELMCLKSSSGAILTKLLGLVTQMRVFDGDLQQIKAEDEESLRRELRRTKDTLEALSASFSGINLEFENLQLIHNKILNLPSHSLDQQLPESASGETPTRKIEDLTLPPATDEFFHLDTSKDIDWEKQETDFDLSQYEFDRANQRLIKSSFKPVLVQLRKRIHPLHDAMREREREFMKSRGVTLPEDSDEDFSDSLDGQSDDEVPKRGQKPGKYEENREFLQEKQQVGLFFSLPPPQNLLSEDVLE